MPRAIGDVAARPLQPLRAWQQLVVNTLFEDKPRLVRWQSIDDIGDDRHECYVRHAVSGAADGKRTSADNSRNNRRPVFSAESS